jgi:anthranilate synthase/phosphoribosyltransferase
MIKRIIEKVMDGKYLEESELSDLVENMRYGKIDDLQFVSLLSAMETRNRIKGISVDECTDFVKSLRVPTNSSLEGVLCNAGTGGGWAKTLNIGTASAVIIAAAGINTLKIGSNGITTNSGSRDVLQSWGIDTNADVEKVVGSVKEVQIGYFDFSKIVPIKGRAGVRSPLHYIGPLCNPVNLSYKILGCIKEEHLRAVEPILERLSDNYILSFNPNIDEISLTDPTLIVEKRNNARKEYIFDPSKCGLPHVSYQSIAHPGDVEKGANMLLEALQGKKGPVRDILALNAGVGIYLAGKADSIRDGFYRAQDIIESGEAEIKINNWRRYQ